MVYSPARSSQDTILYDANTGNSFHAHSPSEGPGWADLRPALCLHDPLRKVADVCLQRAGPLESPKNHMKFNKIIGRPYAGYCLPPSESYDKKGAAGGEAAPRERPWGGRPQGKSGISSRVRLHRHYHHRHRSHRVGRSRFRSRCCWRSWLWHPAAGPWLR